MSSGDCPRHIVLGIWYGSVPASGYCIALLAFLFDATERVDPQSPVFAPLAAFGGVRISF
jgi:hypothetical protein